MTPQEAYWIAASVCGADGILRPSERSFLNRLREALGIPRDRAEALEREAAAGLRIPEVWDEDSRRTLLRLVARSVAADLRLAPDEVEILERLAERLGLHRTEVAAEVYREAQRVLRERVPRKEESPEEVAFVEAALAVRSDGRVTPEEAAMLDMLAAALGIAQERAHELARRIREGGFPGCRIPPESEARRIIRNAVRTILYAQGTRLPPGAHVVLERLDRYAGDCA
jgi:uncharacterized tellurite resistance protein B-like protein